jgi:uncharacterized protein
MSMFLPVAGLSISLLVLLVVGGVIGSLSGLFGVGGGFLVTPILMFLGIPPTVAAASGSCQMVATSSSGMAAHSRLGNVDFKMGTVLLIGGLVGADLGVHAIKLLRALGEADLAITLTYVIVLGSLGSYMFLESFQTLRRGALAGKRKMAPRSEGRLSRLPWQMDFPRSGVRHSILVPLFLSAVVGVLASIMGVGGGFIMIPMMVYLLGMPTHEAVGTSLFQILFLCAGITYMQAATNQTVDLILVLPLALGSAVGAQAGARMGRLLRGEQLMILLATLVLLVTGKMVADLVLMPPSRLKPAEIYRREEVTEPSLRNESHLEPEWRNLRLGIRGHRKPADGKHRFLDPLDSLRQDQDFLFIGAGRPKQDAGGGNLREDFHSSLLGADVERNISRLEILRQLQLDTARQGKIAQLPAHAFGQLVLGEPYGGGDERASRVQVHVVEIDHDVVKLGVAPIDTVDKLGPLHPVLIRAVNMVQGLAILEPFLLHEPPDAVRHGGNQPHPEDCGNPFEQQVPGIAVIDQIA